MDQKFALANRSQSPALFALNTVLSEAKTFSPPGTSKPQTNPDEKLVARLIENIKKQYRRPSPFATWVGQPFPHEYKEMVAADVR